MAAKAVTQYQSPTKWLPSGFPSTHNPCGEHRAKLISREDVPGSAIADTDVRRWNILYIVDIRFFGSSESVRVWVLSKDVSDMVFIGGAKRKALEIFISR